MSTTTWRVPKLRSMNSSQAPVNAGGKPVSRRVLRLPQACAKTGLPKSTLYSLVSQGLFPKPVKLVPGGRAVGWFEDQIDLFLQQREAACDGA
jgi:prophage regulatory protein